MSILKKLAIILMLIITSSLILGGLWYALQGGTVMYAAIGVLYAFSLMFYVKQQEKALYVNSALVVLLIVWVCYTHGFAFLWS